MAEERDVVSVSGNSTVTQKLPASRRLNEDEIKKYAARFNQVLDRGLMNERLSVSLPADMHGEWINNDHASIAMAKSLGFEIDEEFAVKNALHSDGTGRANVGDVVFMVIPRQLHDIYSAQRRERMRKQYDRSHRELREAQQNLANAGGKDLSTNVVINSHQANAMEIQNAIRATEDK